MKKIFSHINPSIKERIETTSREQDRECVMVKDPERGLLWKLDGYAYTTGQAGAVLGISL